MGQSSKPKYGVCYPQNPQVYQILYLFLCIRKCILSLVPDIFQTPGCLETLQYGMPLNFHGVCLLLPEMHVSY